MDCECANIVISTEGMRSVTGDTRSLQIIEILISIFYFKTNVLWFVPFIICISIFLSENGEMERQQQSWK